MGGFRNSAGIQSLALADQPGELVSLHGVDSGKVAASPDPLLAAAIDSLVGLEKIPLAIKGTAWQMKVWSLLRSIPRGETISYRTLAEQAGNPRAARAVASACRSNPVALLIPCHRVVGSGGALTGYRWGLDRKAALLNAERKSV